MNPRLLPALTALLLAAPLSAGGTFEIAVGEDALAIPRVVCPGASFLGDYPKEMPAEIRDQQLDGGILMAAYTPRPGKHLDLAITAAYRLPSGEDAVAAIQTRSDGTSLIVPRNFRASYASLGLKLTYHFRHFDCSVDLDAHRDQVEFSPRPTASSTRDSMIRPWIGGSGTWKLPLAWKAQPFLRVGGGTTLIVHPSPKASLTGITEEVDHQTLRAMVPDSDVYVLVGFRFGK